MPPRDHVPAHSCARYAVAIDSVTGTPANPAIVTAFLMGAFLRAQRTRSFNGDC